MRRRICWPDPDAVCLEGGCGYCRDADFHTYAEIRHWLRGLDDAGVTPERNVALWTAWRRGLDEDFYGRVEVRRR